MELAGRALRIAAVALAAVFLVRAGITGCEQLPVPFSLGPAEFSNLETIQVLRAGQNPYAPGVYAAPPFVFTTYTPLFHQLAALLPMPDPNPFLWGRLLAAAAMLLAGSLPFLVAGRSGPLVAFVATGLFFGLGPVAARTVLLRNDSLGLLLSALAVWAVHRNAKHGVAPIAAVVLSALAVLTKQSFLAAPLACALYLAACDRRALVRFLTAGLVLAGAGAAAAQLCWGGGFWFSTLLAPPRAVLWPQARHVLTLMAHEPLALALPAATGLLGYRDWRKRGRAALLGSPYPAYALLSSLLALASVGKVGSSTNYFVEPFLAMLLWATHALTASGRMPRADRTLVAVATGLVVAGALQLVLLERPAYPWADPVVARQRQLQLEQVRRDIESLRPGRPRVLGLADHPGLFRESDRVQLSFPDFYYWLWQSGALDVRDATRRIAAHEFDVIVAPRAWIESGRPVRIRLWGQPSIPLDTPETLVQAVRRSYRVAGSRGPMLYLVPDDAPDA